MTEEIKNEIKEEEKSCCKCCACCEKIKEFIFKALIVYVGVTLAILTSANILKPKHGCPLKKCGMGYERQLPPPPMMEGGQKMHKIKIKHFKHQADKMPVQNEQIKK